MVVRYFENMKIPLMRAPVVVSSAVLYEPEEMVLLLLDSTTTSTRSSPTSSKVYPLLLLKLHEKLSLLSRFQTK